MYIYIYERYRLYISNNNSNNYVININIINM